MISIVPSTFLVANHLVPLDGARWPAADENAGSATASMLPPTGPMKRLPSVQSIGAMNILKIASKQPWQFQRLFVRFPRCGAITPLETGQSVIFSSQESHQPAMAVQNMGQIAPPGRLDKIEFIDQIHHGPPA
jgi:hypothetical protein